MSSHSYGGYFFLGGGRGANQNFFPDNHFTIEGCQKVAFCKENDLEALL